MTIRLRLNDKDYFTTDDNINVVTPSPFAEARASDGQQRQANILPYSSKIFNSPTGGFGLDRIPTEDADNPLAYRRLWDADADIWPDGVRLPLKKNTISATGLEVVRAFLEFGSDVWALWEDDSGQDVVARRYDTLDWTDGGIVENGSTTGDNRNGQDLIVHKGVMTAVLVGHAAATSNGDTARVYSSSDGVTWTAYTNQPTGVYVSSLTQHEDTNNFRLIDLGSELCVVIHDESGGEIEFRTTADEGATAWSASEVTISEGSPIRGAVLYKDVNGNPRIYVLTDLALYEVDHTAAAWTYTVVRRIPGQSAVYGNRLAVHNDVLYIGIGVEDDAPSVIWTLDWNSSTPWSTIAGLDSEDTVPSDMLGPVRFFFVKEPWVYAHIGGGAASRQARIIKQTPGTGWLPVTKHGTADQKAGPLYISNKDNSAISTPRLHYAIRSDDAAPKADSMFNMAYPETNPTSGIAIDREDTGYVDWPRANLGMPTIPAIFHKFRFDTEDLSADTTSGEFIRVFCGDDGAARTTDFAGNVTSGNTDLSLNAGKGINGKDIAVRTELRHDSGGTDSDTPILRDYEIDYTKKPDDVESWEWVCDIPLTAERTGRTTEQVVTDLIAAEHLDNNVAFTYGQLATTYVDVSLDWDLDLKDPGSRRSGTGADEGKLRTGTVKVMCKQPVFVVGGIGPLNNYIEFDGTDDEVSITDDSAIQDIWSGGGTAMAWVRPDSDGENDWGRVFDKNNNGAGGAYLRVDNDTGSEVNLTFSHKFDPAQTVYATDSTISTGVWSHVAVVFNSDSVNNDAIIYVNGEPVSITVVRGSGPPLTDVGIDLIIGDSPASNRAFDGGIDELSFWNIPLTAKQIKETYQYQLTGSETGLVGYWKMDEGTGTNVADATSNGNDGTLTNGAWGF